MVVTSRFTTSEPVKLLVVFRYPREVALSKNLGQSSEIGVIGICKDVS